MDQFASLLTRTAKERESRVILSADTDDWDYLCTFLRENKKKFAAVKVHQEDLWVWNQSHEYVVQKISELTEGLPIIVDAKLADINRINYNNAFFYFAKGYDAIITHAFQGEEEIRPVIELARELGRGTFLIAGMTSKGNLFTPKQTKMIVEMAKRLDATGVVAPGNDYKILADVRKHLGKEKLIISPGIDTQGGIAEKALKYSDFIIVGRSMLRR